jgi:hypothetical protein
LSVQATIFPHDEGVAVWLSGFEDIPDQSAEVICDTKDDAEALIKSIERKFGIEIPRIYRVPD